MMDAKVPLHRRLRIAIPLVLGLIGCDILGIGGPTERVLLVNHHKVECVGVAIFLCMLVREPGDGQFSYFYGSPEGFTYEWGFLYELEVDEYEVSDPPADASSVRTVLSRVVSKERVPLGTQFDIVLTALDGRGLEVTPGRFRFHDELEFSCTETVDCEALRVLIEEGARVKYRLEHNADPAEPLILVEWQGCDAGLVGSQDC